MKNKKVLWITDDQIDNKEIYIEKFKYNNLDLTLSEKFYYDSKFDLVLVDYGHLGVNKFNIRILKMFYANDIEIIWTGGLGGNDKYTNDCKLMFPEEKWMHNIESWELTDIDYSISKKLED